MGRPDSLRTASSPTQSPQSGFSTTGMVLSALSVNQASSGTDDLLQRGNQRLQVRVRTERDDGRAVCSVIGGIIGAVAEAALTGEVGEVANAAGGGGEQSD